MKNAESTNIPTAEGPLTTLLRRKGTVLIDGAMSTALEAAGCDLNDPLWSGKTLIETPEAVSDVHRDYFLAGADVAITASYQTSFAGLMKHRAMTEAEASEINARAVRCAFEGREAALRMTPALRSEDLLIAGAVGPYGAYLADGSEYRGNYRLTETEFVDFHRARMSALADAGCDLFAIETQPNFDEIRALVGMLETFGKTAWVTVTVSEDALHMADGTPLEDLAAFLGASPFIEAVGVNCLPPERVERALRALGRATSKPLVAYPNSGETYDPTNKTWSGKLVGLNPWEERIRSWRRAGARLLGGCCRTLPADTRVMAEILAKDRT